MTAATAVRERPILFSGPMVRAIMEGRKTQTRRLMKPQPEKSLWKILELHPRQKARCPYGEVGDRLWVRETFANINNSDLGEASYVEYRADGDEDRFPGQWPPECADDPLRPHWRPSIFMPRKLSRITLELTDVRVERLNEISEADVLAEGVTVLPCNASPQQAYAELWESINGKGSWGPQWVWVLTFRRPAAAGRPEGR